MEQVYIGHVQIPPGVAQKLQSKHGITPEEVRAACKHRVGAEWHHHPMHGRRLLIVGRTSQRHGEGRTLKVILQPVDVTDGLWRLRTAIASKGG